MFHCAETDDIGGTSMGRDRRIKAKGSVRLDDRERAPIDAPWATRMSEVLCFGSLSSSVHVIK